VSYVSPVSSAEDARTLIVSKDVWGAVLAGVVVALLTQFALSMLDIAVGAGSTMEAAAPKHSHVVVPSSWIEQSVRDGTGKNATSLRNAAVTAVWAALTSNPQQAQEARERAAQAVAQAQEVSVEQARTQVRLYEQQYRRAVDQARQQPAETSARAVSRGALFGLIGFLLGAVAGLLGRGMGVVKPTLTARVASGLLRSNPLGKPHHHGRERQWRWSRTDSMTRF
jgi:hypothetical protein